MLSLNEKYLPRVLLGGAFGSRGVDLMERTSENVKMYPKGVDLMKMTSKNVKMCSKCVDLTKMTSKNVKMCSKCVDFTKMTSKNVKMCSKCVKMTSKRLSAHLGVSKPPWKNVGLPLLMMEKPE